MKTLTPTLQPNVPPVPIPSGLDLLKARIIYYDAHARDAVKHHIGYIYLAGASLNHAKTLLPHGQFDPWCQAQFPAISKRSLLNYMRFADAIDSKYATVSDLTVRKVGVGAQGVTKYATSCVFDPSLLLAPGDLDQPPEAAQAQILDAVHDLSTGKTLTEMYRALGVIRDPAAPGGFHPPEADLQAWLKAHHPQLLGTKYLHLAPEIQAAFKHQWRPKPIPPELILEGHRERGRQWHDELGAALDDKIYAHWDQTQRAQMRDLFRDWWRALNNSLKAAPGKAKT